MSNRPKSKKVVIQGVTETGDKFRPSDWAQRMSGNLSTFQGRRIRYSPYLIPAVKEGVQCVILDRSLEQRDPEQYREIIDFARNNGLRFCDEISNSAAKQHIKKQPS